MLQLAKPDITRRDALLDAHREWGPGLHEDGFGIGPNDDLDSITGFGVWVDKVRSGPGEVWWVVESDEILGGIALRADRYPHADTHGHLGYGVRPSARARGIASWAVARVLDRARSQARSEVVAVCVEGNVASIRTIEKAGGQLVATVRRAGAVSVCRYAIRLR